MQQPSPPAAEEFLKLHRLFDQVRIQPSFKSVPPLAMFSGVDGIQAPEWEFDEEAARAVLADAARTPASKWLKESQVWSRTHKEIVKLIKASNTDKPPLYQMLRLGSVIAYAFYVYFHLVENPEKRRVALKSSRRNAAQQAQKLLALLDEGVCLSTPDTYTLRTLLKQLISETETGSRLPNPSRNTDSLPLRSMVQILVHSLRTHYNNHSREIIFACCNAATRDNIEERTLHNYIREAVDLDSESN